MKKYGFKREDNLTATSGALGDGKVIHSFVVPDKYPFPKKIRFRNLGAGDIRISFSRKTVLAGNPSDWGVPIYIAAGDPLPYVTTMTGLRHMRIVRVSADTAYDLYWENED